MESLADKLRALGLALALHLLFVLALLAGLWWAQRAPPVRMPGPVIDAVLVGPAAAPKSRHKHPPAPPVRATPKTVAAKSEAKPAPKPEPSKPAQPSAPELTRQDLVEREQVVAVAQQKAAEAKREQEERKRQQQVLLEQQRKKLEEIRRQREVAEKKLRLEQERLAQLQDRSRSEPAEPAPPALEHEAAQAQTGAGGADDSLAARYSAALQAVVTQNWNRPDSAQAGLRCALNITQIPGGEVISAAVGSPCNADAATRRSIEQAVMKAAPLPYQGYEKVFQRSIKFTFRYDGQG